MANQTLHKAKQEKNDEFYTQLSDIENELKHYKDHFKDKVIFCNCDDPYESNFFKYFAMNFNFFNLKKLIATCYMGSPILGEQLSIFDVKDVETSDKKHPYKIEITEVEDENADGAFDLTDVEYLIKNKKNVLSLLKGDGDFRSPECIALLKEADVVVTNPPFSLFREYVAQLIEYKKKFLIIGSVNAITYKEIFPLLKDDKIWLGYGFAGGNAYFKVHNSQAQKYVEGVYNEETKCVKFRNCHWFTNLDMSKRHESLFLFKEYDQQRYPKYDNYKAIEVSKTADIPCNYDEVMGVPVTFLDKHNPDQFEIVGATESEGKGFSNGLWQSESKVAQPLVMGERKYKRIFIKKRK